MKAKLRFGKAQMGHSCGETDTIAAIFAIAPKK